MKTTSINLTDKLPKGLAELYSIVDEQAGIVGVNYLVVGAMARDLVMVHGYGSTVERGTRDVDFGIEVPSWDMFIALRDKLLSNRFTASNVLHKLHFESSDNQPWEIDIVPFGAIEDDAASISWPPDKDREMCVLGFSEALNDALKIQISGMPNRIVPVASPAGICLLKLIAWLDRPANMRSKDADDIHYLIHSYYKIREVLDAMYDEGLMEAQEWDEVRASALKLGRDAAQIMSAKTYGFLEKNLFSNDEKVELLAREMSGRSQVALEGNLSLVRILIGGIHNHDRN